MYSLIRPILFQLPPEQAQKVVINSLRILQRSDLALKTVERHLLHTSERLRTTAFGHEFRNPVGLAAGFDKNAKAVSSIPSLGFGFAEIGTVTPRPQDGNPKPRMFRLTDDNSLINHLGFNNDGMQTISSRLNRADVEIPVGVNIGKMNDSSEQEAIRDYNALAEHFGDFPSYYTINVSCPNTGDEYDEHDAENVRRTVENVLNSPIRNTPVLVKVSPDESASSLRAIARVVNQTDISGVIATNTTTSRPDELTSEQKERPGGLSGPPLRQPSNEAIRIMYKETNVPIIGVGGVNDGSSAYAKIRSGASLVQLYTGLVYEGPSVVREINKQLDEMLARDGFDHISEAVGIAS